MYYTYVLFCKDAKRQINKFYIGSTSDLKERVFRHKKGDIKTTKSYDTIELVYYEASLNKTDAIKRELQLKSGFGRGYIKRRLESYLKNNAELV